MKSFLISLLISQLLAPISVPALSVKPSVSLAQSTDYPSLTPEERERLSKLECRETIDQAAIEGLDIAYDIQQRVGVEVGSVISACARGVVFSGEKYRMGPVIFGNKANVNPKPNAIEQITTFLGYSLAGSPHSSTRKPVF